MKDKIKIFRLGLTYLILICALLFGLANPGSILAADRDATEVVKKASPSVVRVEVRNGFKRVATGVVIDKEGYIATTALISPRDEKLVVIDSGGNQYQADFLGFDPETRIAILQFKGGKLPAISSGSAKDLSPGSWICALGLASDAGITVTQGIVSAVAKDRLRLNLWVTPGMSGAPILDEKGRLVGLLRGVYLEDRPIVFRFRDREATAAGYVLSQAEAPAAGMAMAMPVELVKHVFQEIKTKGRVERGWLGVSIAEDRDGRVVITFVEDKSPAELVNLKIGDIILKIDGEDIRSSDQLVSEIRNRQPGTTINLTIERQGQIQNIKIKLGAVPEEEARRELELRFPDLFRRMPALPPMPELPRFTEAERFKFGDVVEQYRFIGVYLEQLNPELSRYFGVLDGRGLLISRINPGSPAEKAGLKVGDVIVSADGKRVETIEDLTDLIQKKKKGERLSLDIIRDKKKLKVEVEVAEEERRGWLRVEKFTEETKEVARNYYQEMKEWQKEWLEKNKQQLEAYKETLANLQSEVGEKTKELTEKLTKAGRNLNLFYFDSMRRI
ncbi:MAG: PDZ domain-containing protein [Acidobacteriota bacterium]|nr:PDZ domain-containing protein [Acidobacteriota bacterium]